MNNTTIIRKIWERDEVQTRKFVKEYKRMIRMGIQEDDGHCHADREDLVQGAYIRLCTMKQPPELTVKPLTFFKGIIRLMILENSRKHKEDPQPNAFIERIAGSDKIIDLLGEDDPYRLLNLMIQKLPPLCRDLLNLFLRTDNSDEICRTLKISSKNLLYKNKSNCIKNLRNEMAKNRECREFFDLSE